GRGAGVIRRLRELPLTGAAYRDGRLSQSQVDAVLANVHQRIVPLYVDHETELLATVAPLDADYTANVMRHWRHRAEATLPDQDDPPEPERQLQVARLLDGRLDLRGHYDDLVDAETIETALKLAESSVFDVLASQRRADALTDICKFFLDHHEPGASRRN